jgi:hypothetical protein
VKDVGCPGKMDSAKKSRFPSHEVTSAMDRLSIRCGKRETAIAVLHSRPTRRDGKHDEVRRKARVIAPLTLPFDAGHC